MKSVIELVRAANPGRQSENLNRRCHKLFEELGELEEAWLQVTSSNHKQMTLADCREEAADVLIVALDISLTPSYGSGDLTVGFWPPYPVKDYDTIVFEIARGASWFGLRRWGSDKDRLQMIRSSFALVELIFEGDEDAIIAEVIRKLNKWTTQRASGLVATDAE